MLLEQEANAVNSDLEEGNENHDDFDDENAFDYGDFGKRSSQGSEILNQNIRTRIIILLIR